MIKTKKCSKCNKEKILDDFNKRLRSKDGHRSDCKMCHRAAGLEYYYNNHEARKAADRLYNQNNKEKKKAYRDRYKKKNAGKIKNMMLRSTRKYIRNNPEKYQAYQAVYCALKANKIKKEPCSNCGSKDDIMAHHDDYNKPLDIVWLCRTCHISEHLKLRYGAQTLGAPK